MLMKSFKKFFSVLAIFALTLPSGSVRGQTSEAAPSLANFAIPKSLGKIEDRFQGKTSHWIVQIQDVHAHFSAQENISAIIDHLNAVYGVQSVGIEGGWQDTTFKESWGVPSSREKQMLARSLMEKAYITGPGYAALFTQTPLHLIGIEEAKLYEQNRDAFLVYLENETKTGAALASLEKKLQALKQSAFNPELRQFAAALAAFREGRQAEAFLPLVISETTKEKISIEDLDQLSAFSRILGMEKTLDKEKIQAEAARLMKEFKKNRLSFEELLKSGSVPEEKLEHYPASKAYLSMLKEQDRISYRDFFEQIETAVNRIKEKLFTSEEERKLDSRWENFLTAKQILTLRATPDDLIRFEKAGDEIPDEMAAAGLEEALKTALEFYRLARARDEVFFKAVTENPELSKANSVLVTGGFHTADVSRRLREAGISYIVITPDLQGESPDETLYHERMKDPIPAAQTLAPPARFVSPAFDHVFPSAVLDVQRNKNLPHAVTMIAAAMQGEETSPAGAVASQESGGWNIEMWQAMDTNQKKQWILEQVKSAGQERMYLVGTTDTLNLLLQEESARPFVPFLVGERNNTIVVVNASSDVPTELIGNKAQLRRFRGEKIGDAESEIKKHLGDAIAAGRVAVIAPEGEEVPFNALRLKIHPVSLLYRLFLSSPRMRLAAQNEQFLSDLQQILSQIENLETFLKSA